MNFIRKIYEKYNFSSEDIFEFICAVMIMMFALLPGIMVIQPDSYGIIFKLFGKISIFVLILYGILKIAYCMFKSEQNGFFLKLREVFLSAGKIFKNRHFAFLLGAYVLAFVSAFFAADRQRAFWGTDFRVDGVFMYTVFAALFVFGSGIKSDFIKKTVYGVYIFSFLINAVIVIQQYLGVIGSQFEDKCPEYLVFLKDFYSSVNIRTGLFYKGVTGGFYNSNHAGYFLMICLMIISALFINAGKKSHKILFFILCVTASVSLVVNDTFGCYIAACVAYAVLILVAVFKKLGYRKIINISLPLLILILVSVTVTFFGRNTVVKNVVVLKNDVGKIVSSDEKASKAGSNRWGLWVETVDMISEKPLLGYGPDNVNEEYKKRDHEITRAHNEYLEHPLNCGILYALLYFAGIFMIVLRRMRHICDEGQMKKYLVPLMVCTGYLVSAFTGVFLFYTACHFFIMLSLLKD